MAVEWDSDDLLERIRRGAFRGIVMGTEILRTEGNRLIQSPPKTGRVYKRRSVAHQASAPGEAPATDTGRLVQSARTEFDQSKLQGFVVWATNYSLKLEEGTAKMAARPFARPALLAKRAIIEDVVNREIRAEL